MGYLLDVILTRDPWMHRVDIARATGRDLVLTPEHDGRIVADVVAEWARRHGQPFTLTLTGPAGGDLRRRRRRRVDHRRRRRVLPNPCRPRRRQRPAHPGGPVLMETRVAEVAEGVHQLATFFPEMNFGFNQYLIAADEPLLFHTGMRGSFPLVSEAVSQRAAGRVAALGQLRSRRGRRVGLDERVAGARARSDRRPEPDRLHGVDRRPRRPPAPTRSPTARSSTSAVTCCSGSTRRTCRTRGRRACSTTRRPGRCSAATSSPGWASTRRRRPTTSSGRPCRPRTTHQARCRCIPSSAATIRRLAELDVDTLALMHGPAFTGDCRTALLELAEDYERRIAALV